MTRESIQTAVVNGITADQILHYIKANAHPDMLKNASIFMMFVIMTHPAPRKCECYVTRDANLLIKFVEDLGSD